MSNRYYPPSPLIKDYTFLKPSANFIKNVGSVFTAILIFAGSYMILVAVGVLFLYLCVLGAIAILTAKVHWITLALALGILAFGVMFFAFLLKFIFMVKRNSHENRLEINRNDHPKLFDFIDQLTNEVQAPKPKKIFLIPDVNASVFYDSSFWSMFLPVRKNLQIGMGLINTVNLSEFKAIMAHEFGHFSQRSMKLGSYVYTVNQIIYHLVYIRDKWDDTLDSWADSTKSGNTFMLVFGFFAIITRALVNVVRSILDTLYQFINKRYMALSREMEYNADLIAVSAAGTETAITALRRIDVGNAAYSRTLGYLNEAIQEDKLTDNVYSLQKSFIERICIENNLATSNSLPIVDDAFAKKMVPQSRVVYRDQWASHPDQDEREANIKTVNLDAQISDDSAWILFNDAEKWQQKMTNVLYANAVEAEKKYAVLDDTEVHQDIDEKNARYEFPLQYKGFYNNRFLYEIDYSAVIDEVKSSEISFDEIYNDGNTAQISQYFNNINDLRTLEQIRDKAIDTRSFDFDGVKYEREDVQQVIDILSAEIETQKKWLEDLDKKAFLYHYRLSEGQNKVEEFKQKQGDYQNLVKERDKYLQLVHQAEEWMYRLRTKQQWDEYEMPTLNSGMIELYENAQAAFSESAKVSISPKIHQQEISDSYSNYLLPEPIADLSSGFEQGQFIKIYNQIYGMYNKANSLSVESLYELIKFQSIMIDKI